jgi:preprotein translocase subunit YajC
LAQTTQTAVDATQGGGGDVNPPVWADPKYVFYILLGIIVIFVFTSSGRASRQQEKKQKEMLSALKRGDRVQTIGGILGSVVETRDNEVVIKVDEGTNTKIRIVRDAIKKVSVEDPDAK